MNTDDCDLTEREMYVAHKVGEHYQAKFRRVVIAVFAVALIVIVGCVAGWLVIRQESLNRTDAIQQSRVQVLVESCLETNERNHRTNVALDKLTPAHPTAREQRGTQSAKLLVAALVPYRGDPDLAGKARVDDGRRACAEYAQDRLSTTQSVRREG